MIRAALARGDGIVRETPLLSSPFLDDLAGRRVWVKAECLQHTGSFKFRGGWSAVSAMAPDARAKGVIAFSSGNHAQGVALAARMQGAPAVIVMPEDAPKIKIDNTRALGAEVVLYDRENESREDIGAMLARDRGLTLIKPYDEPLVIAGQGTCGIEIARQARAAGIDAADVLICCGGGGLTSGVALAVAADHPGLKVRPAEPTGFDDVARSLATGQIVNNNLKNGLWDAIVTQQPGDLTFPIMADKCGPGLVVTEEETKRAMALAFARLKIVVEPGGAVALAAALFHGDQMGGDDVIAVTTGGNVDPAFFAQVISEFGGV